MKISDNCSRTPCAARQSAPAPSCSWCTRRPRAIHFFAIQFLSALADEALLVFDHADARWSWNLDYIHAKRYTDNVVDLMVGKLGRLPAETRTALCQLSCVGSGAMSTLLGTVCEISQEDLHDRLWEAVRAGVV